MILVVGLLTGALLYIVGSIMERRENAEPERWWREQYGRDEEHR